ncbi:hypothetical protein PC129_g22828 [Phytophthora cactorum]|uniref:Uncharacterized protein n=1 Tax=Phytophthora cactorum TaxID=29920 RepID=A0A8T1H1V5_9STRA|nr:hypothetical protein Pcac1_g22837 [Phytophthora cactorum]KAG2879608.1 hypothetical protein PC115_g22755 [Phytophthora cactorum]KAG2911274.1 hypothetical protein PC114_g9439 [Phytophthora cactorum]KAG3083512.1 hypothetical protein PC122_g10527 [Phytophthora cactorum]KAG3185065.1 hypothetical protein PC128_g13455 [Phytophthora cactorum]
MALGKRKRRHLPGDDDDEVKDDQKSVSNSTVEVSIGAFLTEEGKLILNFENILEDMNHGVSECYDLLNYHALRLCAEGRVVPLSRGAAAAGSSLQLLLVVADLHGTPTLSHL